MAHLEFTERPRLLATLGATDGRDPADQAERHAREVELAQVDQRINRLRMRIAALAEAPQPLPGSLGIGSTVVIDLGDGPERYVLGTWPEPGSRIITMDSPLGRAVREARPGQTVAFSAPAGRSTVTLLAVEHTGGAVA
jgi:transcription elongation GreA/GreB family factor